MRVTGLATETCLLLTRLLFADIDAPLPAAGAAPAAANEPTEEQISMIVDMGFTPAQGRKALRETVRYTHLQPGSPLC